MSYTPRDWRRTGTAAPSYVISYLTSEGHRLLARSARPSHRGAGMNRYQARKSERRSQVAQVVMSRSTVQHENETLAFNYASSGLFHFAPPKPPTLPTHNYESSQTDKPLNPRAHTLAGIIAA
ncbi:hypothetical protein V8E53_006843 [Lactarius tabidus]